MADLIDRKALTHLNDRDLTNLDQVLERYLCEDRTNILFSTKWSRERAKDAKQNLLTTINGIVANAAKPG